MKDMKKYSYNYFVVIILFYKQAWGLRECVLKIGVCSYCLEKRVEGIKHLFEQVWKKNCITALWQVHFDSMIFNCHTDHLSQVCIYAVPIVIPFVIF